MGEFVQIKFAFVRAMLSELVREARFLVEENLGVLVEKHEDIDECETDLFKLDSILSAVGVDCEEEVLAVLEKRQRPNKAKEGILKIIRSTKSDDGNDINYHFTKSSLIL